MVSEYNEKCSDKCLPGYVKCENDYSNRCVLYEECCEYNYKKYCPETRNHPDDYHNYA